MTSDEVLIDVSRMLERDVWRDLVDRAPDAPLIRDACALAAQLLISREAAQRFGVSLSHAVEFIVQTHNLALSIERMGGPKHIGKSILWKYLRDIEDFASALLDMIVERGA